MYRISFINSLIEGFQITESVRERERERERDSLFISLCSENEYILVRFSNCKTWIPVIGESNKLILSGIERTTHKLRPLLHLDTMPFKLTTLLW